MERLMLIVSMNILLGDDGNIFLKDSCGVLGDG